MTFFLDPFCASALYKLNAVMKNELLSCASLLAIPTSGMAATPPAPKVIEAQRRMDFTGMGSFHRIGMLREMKNVRRGVEKVAQAAAKSR